MLKVYSKNKAIVSQQLDGTLCYSIIEVARLKTACPSMSLTSLFASSLMDQPAALLRILAALRCLASMVLLCLRFFRLRTVTDCIPPRHLCHRHPRRRRLPANLARLYVSPKPLLQPAHRVPLSVHCRWRKLSRQTQRALGRLQRTLTEKLDVRRLRRWRKSHGLSFSGLSWQM